jgi:hypothetical protein
VVRAPDAAAQLVELGEAELVGAVDDDGVGGRNIDAGLDDGRAQEHVEAALVEIAHDVLELALAHLPVRDVDARLGQELHERRLDGLDSVDVVVQEIDLPAALQLAQRRLADERPAVARDEGLDREPALGRGGDHGEVAQTLQRHRERAGYRRRGEREHVDLGAQRLQALLLAHAEAVLLVDNHQPEVLELDVAR